ncbi:MAG TPA: SCO family protein [Tepidisphaeraceae bacterium]|jgi:protein SCO1/2|nr:SCO family protein [Tepidisphaeraceae bacterium]
MKSFDFYRAKRMAGAVRRRMCRYFLAAACLLCASLASAQVPAPIKTGPVGGPPILRDVGIVSHEGDSIPFDLLFTDEKGRPVRLAQYFGRRPIILALVYYRCPMLCTMVLNDLTRAMNSLTMQAGDQFDVLAVSFDPSETPALAAAKKEQYQRAYRRPHAEEGMHFLTGPQESISRLTNAVGFRYAWDPKFQQWAHSSGLVILTPDGHISRYFYGIDYAPNDLRLALAEAGEKKISRSVSTRVLLYCFHYDPSTGKYGLAVMRMIQTGGIITLVLLGGSIWLTVRRDRKRVTP